MPRSVRQSAPRRAQELRDRPARAAFEREPGLDVPLRSGMLDTRFEHKERGRETVTMVLDGGRFRGAGYFIR